MPYALAPFDEISLDESLLQLLIDEHESITLPRLLRLWLYYRNALAATFPLRPMVTRLSGKLTDPSIRPSTNSASAPLTSPLMTKVLPMVACSIVGAAVFTGT